jgi:hypothetical protein
VHSLLRLARSDQLDGCFRSPNPVRCRGALSVLAYAAGGERQDTTDAYALSMRAFAVFRPTTEPLRSPLAPARVHVEP